MIARPWLNRPVTRREQPKNWLEWVVDALCVIGLVCAFAVAMSGGYTIIV